MNIKELNLNLDSSRLAINLLLYRTVKEVIQAKISEKHIINLIEQTKLIIQSKQEFDVKKEKLLNYALSLSKSSDVQIRLYELVENNILENIHFNVFKLSLNILRFKDYILEQSKLYSENFKACDDIHIMDFEYDQKMLNLPYASRVSGALLVKILFEKVHNNSDFYRCLTCDIEKISQIDPEIILQVIFAESVSQSIRSSSGTNYEDRFETLLKANDVSYQGQSFDENLHSVEYDFKIYLENNKTIGVSAKRTLRERYKQNHEDIDKLEVDAMILVTLGIDLNKAKVDYILEKDKHYIFVASDMYNKIDYFYNNDRVLPLSDLNKDSLINLLK